MEHIELTLYGLKPNNEGNAPKIRAIKAMKAIAALNGMELTLKHGKQLVDHIDQQPIIVMCSADEEQIVRLALTPWFELEKPHTRPTYLQQWFTPRQ